MRDREEGGKERERETPGRLEVTDYPCTSRYADNAASNIDRDLSRLNPSR